jgi:hypothetical protein
MPCCGQKRQLLVTEPTDPVARPAPPPPPEPVDFEYTGRTGLTVIGPVTGAPYRFAFSGAVVPVDPRDAPSLTAVPRLRRV